MDRSAANRIADENGALLACRSVTVRFGGLIALDALNLEVRAGEFVGLIGPNGSGKTTFFNVLTGIYSASMGEARFAGHDLVKMSAPEICRAGIARTFQRSRLCLPLTVFDNLMIGNHRRLDQGLWHNLFARRQVRAEFVENFQAARELARAFNPTLADKMTTPVGALTMIDRRRVEVCRALIGRPKLLLLDEPSAGMTHEETGALMDDLLEARTRLPGLAIILIEHEMGVIERVSDHCVVLNYGQKICEGSYAHVSADSQVQEAYLGRAEPAS